MIYELVEANSTEEALEKSKWKTGGDAKVVGVGAIANSDGTYTVIPEFKPKEKCHGPVIVSEVCEADRVQSKRSGNPVPPESPDVNKT